MTHTSPSAWSFEERTISAAGHRVRLLCAGTGPRVVLLCHGFPGLAFGFRHQLRALAEAGFLAIAPDMLGYGGTDAPLEVSAYAEPSVTAFLIGILDALRVEKAVVVGHDFGAPAAWNLALAAPSRVAGLALLSAPYEPRRARERPTETFARLSRSHFLHLHYFQEPGVAERELDAAPGVFLQRLYWALSGGFRYLDVWKHPSEGRGYLDVLPEAPPLPWPWLTREDFEVIHRTFARTGFRGGLSWYRAMDLDWIAQAEKPEGRVLSMPLLFLAGARDPVVEMRGPSALARMQAHAADVRSVHLIEGAGHWVQSEAADEVSRRLVAFARDVG